MLTPDATATTSKQSIANREPVQKFNFISIATIFLKYLYKTELLQLCPTLKSVSYIHFVKKNILLFVVCLFDGA